jgi:hypothetical protein
MITFQARKTRTPLIDGIGPFGNEEDESDTIDKEIIGGKSPLPYSKSADNDEAVCGKENVSISQYAARSVSFDSWDLDSTTPDDETFDDAGPWAMKKRNQFEEAAQSFLQLSHGDALNAANPTMDAYRGLRDESRPRGHLTSLTKLNQLGGYRSNCNITDSDEGKFTIMWFD